MFDEIGPIRERASIHQPHDLQQRLAATSSQKPRGSSQGAMTVPKKACTATCTPASKCWLLAETAEKSYFRGIYHCGTLVDWGVAGIVAALGFFQGLGFRVQGFRGLGV